jgi:OOP family OmpA-OmpF porin
MEGDNMKATVTILAITASAFALPASAQMRTPSMSAAYIGLGIGQSKAKDACTGFAGAGLSCDDKDTALKLFGGYQVNRNFAGEFGYTKLGKSKFSGPGGSDEISSNVWELSAIGAWPVMDQLSIFGRLGGYHGETKLSGVDNGKKTTTDLTFGFGVQYDFNRNLGLRGEWQRYKDLTARNDLTAVEAKSDVDVFGISAIWRFQ